MKNFVGANAIRTGTLSLAGAFSILSAGVALAGENWPTSIVGTWNGISGESTIVITITTQAPTGRCRPVTGTFFNPNDQITDNLVGFYCPATGRLHFNRVDRSTNSTYQDYSGNLSDINTPLYMAGVFAAVNGAPYVGEYSFYASK